MKVKSIQCKKCAAPLSLHGGGHRIRSLTCEYCGAVMKVQEDFALLGQFKDQSHPDCPLSLGTQGTIKDVLFTVIGTVSYRSNYGDSWTDLHLYSETHGYAWLSYQLGHFTFTRRVRYLPSRNMKQLSPREVLRVNDQPYQFLEAYQTEVTHVAGELTWIAKVGDTSILRDAISPPFMFSQEETENEQEYHLTEYIDPEVIDANFELEYDTHRSFVHPAQPFKAPIRKALSKASLIPMVLSVLFMFFLTLLNMGNTVLSERITHSQMTGGLFVQDFTINNANHLVEIQFDNAYGSQFQVKDITLFDDTHEVFTFGKKLKVKSSTISSQQGTAQFKIKKAGKYTLRLRAITTRKWANSDRITPYISLTIKEGVMNNRYLKYLFYISIICFLLFYISRYFFNNKRWE